MTSITTWQRLEPLPRSDDLRPSVRAEIADPLWLLARQRQFGELRGEDAGTPIVARLEATAGRISRLLRGQGGGAGAVDHDDTVLPLEVAVEREGLRASAEGGGVAVEAGLHFLRLLRAHRATALVGLYVDHYKLDAAALPGDDAGAARLRRRAAGRVPDGRRLYADLAAARGALAALNGLPGQPAVPVGEGDKALAAARAFMAWWESFVSEPAEGQPDAWNPRRLEHSFAVQADMPDGRVVLRADEYRGGRLDWHSFTAAGQPSLGDPGSARAAETVVRTVIPTPAEYRGMPASRFWEIEDGSVRYGSLATGRTDLARMLLSEFALTYGNDWFVIPVDLPVGSVCALTRFEVTDTFGETTSIRRSANGSGALFRLFELDAPAGPQRVSQLFFLPPALADVAESDPVEEAGFIRDEMANVVWGVERRYQGGAGTPVDRYEEHQRRRAVVAQRVDVDFGDAHLLYRLATDVPYHWFPFVPVTASGAAVGQGVIQFERRDLVRVLADGSSFAPQPGGRILTAADPLRVEEEEVPRSGADCVRTFQLTRWLDGCYVVWSGKHRKVGRGEGSSGLRFDAVEPAVRS